MSKYDKLESLKQAKSLTESIIQLLSEIPAAELGGKALEAHGEAFKVMGNYHEVLRADYRLACMRTPLRPRPDSLGVEESDPERVSQLTNSESTDGADEADWTLCLSALTLHS